jgi:hypothetical protein
LAEEERHVLTRRGRLVVGGMDDSGTNRMACFGGDGGLGDDVWCEMQFRIGADLIIGAWSLDSGSRYQFLGSELSFFFFVYDLIVPTDSQS